MFDTVILKARPIPIDSDILKQYNEQSITFLNKETGAFNTSYKLYDEKLPFITYIGSSQTSKYKYPYQSFYTETT
jgi:hypothetical protein